MQVRYIFYQSLDYYFMSSEYFLLFYIGMYSSATYFVTNSYKCTSHGTNIVLTTKRMFSRFRSIAHGWLYTVFSLLYFVLIFDTLFNNRKTARYQFQICNTSCNVVCSWGFTMDICYFYCYFNCFAIWIHSTYGETQQNHEKFCSYCGKKLW